MKKSLIISLSLIFFVPLFSFISKKNSNDNCKKQGLYINKSETGDNVYDFTVYNLTSDRLSCYLSGNGISQNFIAQPYTNPTISNLPAGQYTITIEPSYMPQHYFEMSCRIAPGQETGEYIQTFQISDSVNSCQSVDVWDN